MDGAHREGLFPIVQSMNPLDEPMVNLLASASGVNLQLNHLLNLAPDARGRVCHHKKLSTRNEAVPFCLGLCVMVTRLTNLRVADEDRLTPF
jgi:hypothetical protein